MGLNNFSSANPSSIAGKLVLAKQGSVVRQSNNMQRQITKKHGNASEANILKFLADLQPLKK